MGAVPAPSPLVMAGRASTLHAVPPLKLHVTPDGGDWQLTVT